MGIVFDDVVIIGAGLAVLASVQLYYPASLLNYLPELRELPLLWLYINKEFLVVCTKREAQMQPRSPAALF